MKTLDILSTIGALVLAATPLAVAGAANAAPANAVVIPVSDLDFTSKADVSRFDVRVAGAADSFCGDIDARDLQRSQSCRSAVRDEAVGQLGSDQRQEMATGHGVDARIAAR